MSIDSTRFKHWTGKKYLKQSLRHNIEADFTKNLIKCSFDDGNISELG